MMMKSRIAAVSLHSIIATAFAGPVLIASCAALLLTTPAYGQSTPGTPISGTSVGLDHEPEGLRIEPRQTDARGSVTFTGLAPGRYTVYLADASTLKAPVRVSLRVTDSFGMLATTALVSEPILPAKGRGRAYALDRNGRRLVVEIPAVDPKAGERARAPIVVIILAVVV